jgi:hypothetical protein
MHRLVRTVLSKLYTLDPVSEEKKLSDVPSTPAVGTFPPSVTQSDEPGSHDPTDTPQPVTSTVRSHQDATVTQKLDCMS